jgi:hypothetical protein
VTLPRFSLVLLGTLGLIALGCDDGDDTAGDTEADTDADADADTDTDTDADSDPDYMDVYWWTWAVDAGVKDGQFANFFIEGDEYPSMVDITLAEKEWTDDWDDRYACDLVYSVTSVDGTSDPKAWYDWSVTLTGEESLSTCDNLDPAMFGDDPFLAFSEMAWEFTVLEITTEVSDTFEGWFADDWDALEPAMFGADTYLDGTSIAEANDEDQMMGGFAFTVDADMNVGEDWVDATDVAAGADGYYRIINLYIYGMAR